MSGQLEQSQDSNDRKELQDVGVLKVGRQLLEHQVDVEAQGGDVVDDVNAENEE